MEKMQELYQKVAGDAVLQGKFNGIIADAEKLGPAETQNKLIAFAKEAGYDVTVEEMQAYFTDVLEQNHSELSDAELDMVAGGKLTAKDGGAIAGGVILAASVVAGFTGVGLGVSVGCIATAGVIEGATS